MATIAVMTVSDGRPYVHQEIESFGLAVQRRIVRALGGLGHRVVSAPGDIHSNATAVAVARELASARPDLTIVNVPVWAFPHFTVLAARETPGAVLLFSNIDPQYPGMVGMLAAGGGLDQIGRQHERAWGDIEDQAVLRRLDALARAGSAASALRGSTFGRIGGRPMGMYTAVSATDIWMQKFGIDVEEIDQYELVRRSASVPRRPGTCSPRVARAACGRSALRRVAANPRTARTADPRLLHDAGADQRVEAGLLPASRASPR